MSVRVRTSERLILGVAFACLVMAASQALQAADRSVWAAQGQMAYEHPDGIPAPDGRAAIRVDANGLAVIRHGTAIEIAGVLATPNLTEVLWSPDSRAVAITLSDGGLVGSWTVAYFTVDRDGSFVSHDVQRIALTLGRTLPKCDEAEIPNVGAVGWRHGSRELLVIVQVPPHSSCHNAGERLGLRISTSSWAVVERVRESDSRRKWAAFLPESPAK